MNYNSYTPSNFNNKKAMELKVIYTLNDVLEYKKTYYKKYPEKNIMKLNLLHCVFQKNNKSIYLS